MSEEKYVMVTTISTHRMKYCVRMSDLQAENPDAVAVPEWALDAVTAEDIEEFSQKWLGEVICDHRMMSEQEVLEMFDDENPYLAGDENKLEKFVWPAYNKKVGAWKRNNKES
jgi:hypothetical protein